MSGIVSSGLLWYQQFLGSIITVVTVFYFINCKTIQENSFTPLRNEGFLIESYQVRWLCR
jgi:hypothetical protein